MKRNRDPVVEELHRRREAHYEKTKHLSPEAYAEHVNRKAETLARRYGLRLRYAERSGR